MPTWRVADLVDWACGTLLRGDERRDVSGVSTDSRTVQAGNVFVALRGERFDGHHFLHDAVRRGAACVVVSDAACLGETAPLTNGADPSVIGVANTEKALQDLATAHRRKFQGSVVAVTGSNGKTTVKEMTASVLQTWFFDPQDERQSEQPYRRAARRAGCGPAEATDGTRTRHEPPG